MPARQKVAAATFVLLMFPWALVAQGRGSIGTAGGGSAGGRTGGSVGGSTGGRTGGQTGGSVATGPGRSGPTRPGAPGVGTPPGTIGFRPALGHRPIFGRSPLLGFVYFDPYWAYDWPYSDRVESNISNGVGGPPFPESSSPRLSGGLQLDVEPRRALVYVDGVLVGTVDQYKGYFQHLETSAGYHVLEFFAPDYEPLITGVTVVPKMTTTFRGFLNRANGR